MKTTILVRLQVEGMHNWQDAATIFPKMGFLSSMHRHMFHLEVEKLVSHDDRDIEIIAFKREIIAYLNKTYYDESLDLLNFGGKSCEMLAQEILQQFNCYVVTVTEDFENGSKVYAQ